MPTDTATEHQEVQRARLALGVVLLGALVARAVAWLRTEALFNDGPAFLWIAQRMSEGDWSAALSHDYHPLYPLAIATARTIVPDWETAAVCVSIAGGVAAVGFLYGLVRDAFGDAAALAAAGLAALHPRAVDFTADVQSEGLYLACFMGALWLGWRGIRRDSLGAALGAGLVSGLAYLTRPEGVGALLVAGACVAWAVLGQEWRLRRGMAWVCVAGLGGLLVAGPYLTTLRSLHDEWSLTRKKSVAVLSGVQSAVASPPVAAPSAAATPTPAVSTPPPAREPPRWIVRVADLLSNAAAAARPEFALLILAGAWLARGRPGPRGRFFGSLLALYGLVLVGLTLHVGYVSRRHVFPVFFALLGFAGLAAPALGSRILGWMGRGASSRRAAVALGVCLTLLPSIPALARARRGDKVALRHAAEWLRDHRELPGGVAARRERTSYYARSEFVGVTAEPHALEADALRARGAAYLILDADDLDAKQWRVLLAQPGLRLVRSFEVAGHEARIVAVDGTSIDDGRPQ